MSDRSLFSCAAQGRGTLLAEQTTIFRNDARSVLTTMTLRTVYFFSLLCAAFALVPAGAHLAELVNKIKLDVTDYQTDQQIYRGWELFGVVVVGALVSTLALTIALRGHPTAFTPALVACLCIVRHAGGFSSYLGWSSSCSAAPVRDHSSNPKALGASPDWTRGAGVRLGHRRECACDDDANGDRRRHTEGATTLFGVLFLIAAA